MNYPRMPKKRPDLRRRRKRTPERSERQLDEALEQSVPASDPVSITNPGSAGPDDEEQQAGAQTREVAEQLQ